MPAEIDSLLRKTVQLKASDLHIKANSHPIVRVDGNLSMLQDEKRFTAGDTLSIAKEIMSEGQMEQFQKKRDLDFAYSISGEGRFRCNTFMQRGTVSLVFRYVSYDILDIEQLYLPAVLKKISMEPRGLILVTGATGSGKSTTLASMIDYINTNKALNIITIEDPIEFLHRDKKSIVRQREIGTDAETFGKSLRSALRQDPDVILVGEMRDFETVQTALVAAETGHLVLSTLHTTDAVETINRIISVFPPYQHRQVRTQLASVLKAIVSMRLVPKADESGRVPAVEILVATSAIKDAIENADKTKNINEYIAGGVSQYGMQTFDQSLFGLYKKGLVTYEDALSRASNPDDFILKVKGVQSTKDVYDMGDVISESESKKGPDIERFSK